jgi:GNAT superfamily N-acetyltransferase
MSDRERDSAPPSLDFHPLTRARFADFAKLFGTKGACGGCWCMWWRLPKAEFEKGRGALNRRRMRDRVARGDAPGIPPGILAYEGSEPIGWCAVAPRDEYPRLDSSRVLARLDAEPVWSIGCLFVAKARRGRGVSAALLRAAAEFAASRGAEVVEGYPVDSKASKMPDAFAWTGLASAFLAVGFEEVARRSATRPIMRISLERAVPPRHVVRRRS